MKLTKAGYSGLEELKVLSVKHWTRKTFSFVLERPPTFRFRSGEFGMVGLENGARPILRAYSIASPSWDEKLEFYSIKVDDGPLTSRLQKIKINDKVLLKPKPVGTLVLDALLPGKRLILFSTGTGIAPFASIIRDPETYEKFGSVVVTQTCRYNEEHLYAKSILRQTKENELLAEVISGKLSIILTTTRETSPLVGRITNWLADNRFEEQTGMALNLETDRVMICGGIEMLFDHKRICESLGMIEGSNSNPGHYVIEKAFVN